MGYISYLIYALPVLILTLLAQWRVNSEYKKFSKIANSRHLTGAAAAQQILKYYGVSDVRVAQIGGKLTDNYNPKDKTIYLSEGVYGSTSVAAVGIACHEAGHAAQHAENFVPNKIRTALVPITNFGSRFGLYIAIAGYLLSMVSVLMYNISYYIIVVGLALFGLSALFTLVTLPVEFNASHRALKVIDETNLLEGSEYKGARRVLTAAAMTYVAAFATSLVNLMYYASMFLGNRSRRR